MQLHCPIILVHYSHVKTICDNYNSNLTNKMWKIVGKQCKMLFILQYSYIYNPTTKQIQLRWMQQVYVKPADLIQGSAGLK